MRRVHGFHAGMTLIELLVVLAITAVLAALLLPAVQQAREAARRTQCANHIRQIGLAVQNYHSTFQILPPGSMKQGTVQPGTGWGWGAMILPSLEQHDIYSTIDFSTPTGDGGNGANVLRLQVSPWHCPSDPAGDVIITSSGILLSTGNYSGSAGYRGAQLPGVLYEMSAVRFEQIRDGTSHTFLCGERLNQPDSGGIDCTSGWYGFVVTGGVVLPESAPHLEVVAFLPINMSPDFPGCFGSRHAGGAQFGFCDGSVRFVSQTIDVEVYQALGTRAGGEPTGY